MVGWAEMPRSPGHVFYDRLQSVLIEGGFDGFAEAACRSYYAARLGAPSVPPGRYFRMHLVGYFEGIDSERGLEWRCSDSLSLREFLRLESRDRVPDHSWLSRTRARLPHEVHTAIFDWVLALIAEAGLVKGERIGVDASTMEANAALRNIVRPRDTGEGYRGMLARLAQESGIETPTAEDLARLDRKRKGKKLSNQDWVSKSDPEAKIAKMKDGTTHLAYKPEHAVDLDTGAVVAAELHPADEGDTTTLEKTLAAAKENLEAVDAAPTAEDPAAGRRPDPCRARWRHSSPRPPPPQRRSTTVSVLASSSSTCMVNSPIRFMAAIQVPPAPDRPCVHLSDGVDPADRFLTPLLGAGRSLRPTGATGSLASGSSRKSPQNDLTLARHRPSLAKSQRACRQSLRLARKRGRAIARPHLRTGPSISSLSDAQNYRSCSGPPWTLRLSQFCVQGNRVRLKKLQHDRVSVIKIFCDSLEPVLVTAENGGVIIPH